MSVASTVLSALSNFLFTAGVAHSASRETFGKFAVCAALISAFTFLARSTVGQMLLLHPSSAREGLRVSWIAALFAAAVLTALSLTLRLPPLFAVTVAVGGGLLLVQDAYRYIFLAAGDARSAALLDLVWLVAMLPIVPLLSITSRSNGLLVVAFAWTVGAALSGGLGRLRRSTLPSGQSSWPMELRILFGALSLEGLSFAVAGFALYPGLLATCGPSCAGAYRAGEVLASPGTLIAIGVLNMIPSELRRTRAPRQTVERALAPIAAVQLCAVLGLLAFGEPIAASLLGPSGHPALVVAPLLIANSFLGSAATAFASMLRFGGRTRTCARLRALVAPLQPLAATIAGLEGVRSAALAAVAAQAVHAGLLLGAARRPLPSPLEKHG